MNLDMLLNSLFLHVVVDDVLCANDAHCILSEASIEPYLI